MPFHSDKPAIAFLFFTQHISNAVLEASRRTGTKAIFDLADADPAAIQKQFLPVSSTAASLELKLAADILLNPILPAVLKEINVSTVWVELHEGFEERLPAILDKLSQLSDEFVLIPITGSLPIIRQILDLPAKISLLALKGNEASGFVGSETIFTLYAAVQQMIQDRSGPPGLAIWGGLALPEAAAAFLATGSKCIVFESLHWLTDLFSASADFKRKVGHLRPDHTELVGLGLGMPYRLFNKGNSRAARDLKEFLGVLSGSEIPAAKKTEFYEKIQRRLILFPLGSFNRDELLPLGIEACFASSFLEKYGSGTETAVTEFIADINRHLAQAPQVLHAFLSSPVARELGVSYPFIQGAMSWITDNPRFARCIAEAGGLATIALGMMDEAALEAKLGSLPQIMGDFPYAVNVVALNENPFLVEQIQWIKRHKPRFAVIAAGEPGQAADLLEDGIEPIYIAANVDLLRLAFEKGLKFIVCEGNEAGGHVGQYSTVTWAQLILDLRRRNPKLFEDRRIILAGGICHRLSAFMAAMLGADAIQMGTAYLAVSDIIATGSLTPLYQRMIIASEPGSTLITGEATGLRIRSLKTRIIDRICALEQDFLAKRENAKALRREIEALSAGSLRIAAQAICHQDDSMLADQTCLEQGQFMSGAAAGIIKTIKSVRELHLELAAGPLAAGLPFTGPLDEPAIPDHDLGSDAKIALTPKTRRISERIAITGMSIVNSLGNSPEGVWLASLNLRSGVSFIPSERWDYEPFYHPRPGMPEKTYCRVGAFQDLEISRKDIGIPPQDFRTMTDATRITLWLASQAIQDSGILNADIPRDRIGVFISQNSGEAAATLPDLIIRTSLSTIMAAVNRAVPLSPELQAAVGKEVKAGRLAIDDTTLLGRLNCSAGGFICNKYGFMGPSFSVSAACATSLVALFSAYQMIRNGVIDAAIVGGAEEFLTPMHFLEFSALSALAGLSGDERPPAAASRPFCSDRDGMVLGEGGGLIVIERESLAQRRKAKVYAYITSMGASNNHLGMIESSRLTQEIALRASFKDLPYGPESVDLVECHATSTRQGDIEEGHALKSLFQSAGKTVLTSFKSQIGHTLGASGLNSLIRGVMAMNAGIFPPTLNYRNPDPEMELGGSGMVIYPEPEMWPLNIGGRRRLQVNAFGFGGSNYVVQLEQAGDGKDVVLVTPQPPDCQQEPGQGELPPGLSFFRTDVGGQGYRLAIQTESEEQALSKLKQIRPLESRGPVKAKRLKALARQGIHLAAEEPPPNLAFVFPGQGSYYAGMSHELYQTFPAIREWLDRAAAVADFDLLDLMFHAPNEELHKTRWQQPALFAMEYAMVQYLRALGIRPAALAGHSLGELTALCLAGVYSFEDGFRIVNKRAVCMDKACTMHMDPGAMMAVDVTLEVLQDFLADRQDVYITNLNSPHQIVVGGNTAEVHSLGAELQKIGYRNTLLPVSMAFHSPIMHCLHAELDAFLAGIDFQAPRIPVVSNTTMAPFPSDPRQIKGIIMAHLESPVHWMTNIRTLWHDFGIRLFVEVGPREILSNLILETIPEAACLPTCLPSAEALVFKTAIAQLYARGNLPLDQPVRFVSLPGMAQSSKPVKPEVAATPAQPPQHYDDPLKRIIERQMGSFILANFGRSLKPSILEAIRAEYDPSFSEQKLDQILSRMFPDPGNNPLPAVAEITQPEGVGNVTRPPLPSIPLITETDPEADHVEDITEAVIRILMAVTGYERDEIDPDMDLRNDLAIRSSRLPVIMDALEGHFGIIIEFADFREARTIQDVSEKISQLLTSDKSMALPNKAQPLGEAEIISRDKSAVVVSPVKRVVFEKIALLSTGLQPVELTTFDSVAVWSSVNGADRCLRVGEVLRRDYGCDVFPMAFVAGNEALTSGAFDLRLTAGVDAAAKDMQEIESLAGLIIVLDSGFEAGIRSVSDGVLWLEGFFGLLKVFLDSPAKKFVTLINHSEKPWGFGQLLTEGLLGIFLSAVQEFPSVLFRSVTVNADAQIRDVIRGALDRKQKYTETSLEAGQSFTLAGKTAPIVFREEPHLRIGPDDVILFTGGCSGIMPFLAQALVPFGCKMAFMGRKPLGPYLNFKASPGQRAEPAAIQTDRLAPGFDLQDAAIAKGSEIVKTLDQLRDAGIVADYFPGDVSDPQSVASVVHSIQERFGQITGVVHGAGILRDKLIKDMTATDFSSVVQVKFLGAWHLMQETCTSLKFFACLSSAACIQGNLGQANYACANRGMSALMSYFHDLHPGIIFKAFMLPPIEGAGMAENQDIKAYMKLVNAAYIHVDELSDLFSRELFLGPPEDVWVMFKRSLPRVKNVCLEIDDIGGGEEIEFNGVVFDHENFPLIDAVSALNVPASELVAEKSFNQAKDLWISDHKPFKSLRHPLVSAIMAIECFMEACRILHPNLQVIGVKDAHFLDIIECPAGVTRDSQLHCKTLFWKSSEVGCDVSLATKGIARSGDLADRLNLNYRAFVLLGATPSGHADLDGFPIKSEELDSRPMDHKEVIEWYQNRSDLQNRYRVIDTLDGSAPGAVRGRMIYRHDVDFKVPGATSYQYSPYLLEALMQVASFYVVMRNPAEQRSMIPLRIGEMLFWRTCTDNEEIVVEARINERDDEGITWDARAVGTDGEVIMIVKNLRMGWFYK